MELSRKANELIFLYVSKAHTCTVPPKFKLKLFGVLLFETGLSVVKMCVSKIIQKPLTICVSAHKTDVKGKR